MVLILSGMERIKDGIGDKLGMILAAVGTFIGGTSLGFYLRYADYNSDFHYNLIIRYQFGSKVMSDLSRRT